MGHAQTLPIAQSTIGERVKELKLEYCRLMILQILNEASGYSAHDDLLHDMLIECSYHISFDQLRTNLAWLQEQGVLKVKEHEIGNQKNWIVTLTQRGSDVTHGRAWVPGIHRPRSSDV